MATKYTPIDVKSLPRSGGRKAKYSAVDVASLPGPKVKKRYTSVIPASRRVDYEPVLPPGLSRANPFYAAPEATLAPGVFGVSPASRVIHPGISPDQVQYQLHPGVEPYCALRGVWRDSALLLPPIPTLDCGVTDHYTNHDAEYLGFNGNTYIQFWHDRLPNDVDGHLVFRGEPGPRFPEVWFPFRFIGGTGTTTVNISTNPNTRSSRGNWVETDVYGGTDLARPFLFFNLWWGRVSPGNGVDTDRFDHIQVRTTGSTVIQIHRVRVMLNGIVDKPSDPLLDDSIADKTFDGAGYTLRPEPAAGWDLDPYIWQRRLDWIRFKENWRRFRDTNEECREILYWAASDIGQTWSPRYGEWHWDPPTPPHHGNPRDWCSEFVNYTIARASRGRVIPFDFGAGITTDYWRVYFRWRGRYISTDNTSDDQLGGAVRPGFYARVNQGGHSTIFVSWCRKDGSPTDFDNNWNWPDHKNYFLGIGGNQDHGRVSVNVYSLARREAEWGENESGIVWHKTDDGFGDTSHF